MRQYKDSGVEWIGKIPETWEVLQIRRIMRNRSERNQPSAVVLSLYRDWGIVPKDSRDDNHNVTSEDTSSYKVVSKGNFVINKMKAWQGSMAVSDYDGIISPAYYVCSFTKEVCKKYVHYLLRDASYKPEYMRLSTGMRIGQWDLNIDDFLRIKAIIPPLAEQQRIADYLDEKCVEIDSLISLQEQMIEKLKAYKQSVITEAVTKGLDPNAKLVPSGIDWIGEIPEEWLITDIKNLCISITDGSHFSPERQSEGMPYITAGDIRGKGIDYNNAMRIRLEDYNTLESQGCRPHKGDVLMVKDGATTGRVGMMTDDEKCVLLSSVAMLTPLSKVDSNYLMYLVQSNVIQAQIKLLMAGSAMPRVTLKKINSLKGLLIPLNTQRSIAAYLDSKCSDIDRLIALKQQKIETLKDYKKSVIYEAVTGKTLI